MENHPSQTVIAYYQALSNKDIPNALSFVSEYSLYLTGTSREDFQSHLDKLINEQNWELIEHNIVETRPLDDNTILVHSRLKTKTGNGEPSLQDEWVACHLENGNWYFNINSVVDAVQLNNSPAEYNNVVVTFSWLVRYINTLIVYLSITNNTQKTVFWGLEGEPVIRFMFGERVIEQVWGFQIKPNTHHESVWVKIDGWYSSLPTKIELINWRISREAHPQTVDLNSGTWFYEIPVTLPHQSSNLGNKETIDSKPRQCLATTKAGKRCKNKPATDSLYCHIHEDLDIKKQQDKKIQEAHPQLQKAKRIEEKRKLEEVRKRESAAKKFIVRLLFLVIAIGIVWVAYTTIRDRNRPSSYIDNSVIKPICESVTSDEVVDIESGIGNGTVSYDTGQVTNVTAEELNLSEANSEELLDTLICITEKRNVVEVCRYEVVSTTITRVRYDWEVLVVDWDTKGLIGKEVFTGHSPDRCPSEIGSGDVFSREIDGDVPIEKLSIWLQGMDR